eukprot:TRINITY_DN38192_c0_g1_i1.p1 TRINITY_DN38192_c0_g1~~TRINITY_DN38192_c0_g1_i1.p1  ORF type:complete len:154 (+),score=40.78 TRINITY_DN38192_c0_g1_i1:26-463(+)
MDTNDSKVQVDDSVLDAWEAIRKKNARRAAFICKVNKNTLTVELDEEFDNIEPEDLAEELTLSAPRFIIYSYEVERADGRKQLPLCLLYYSPSGGRPDSHVLYTRAKPALITKLAMDQSKVLDFNDVEDFTTEWLTESIIKRYTR